MIGTTEWTVIIGLALLLFGAKAIPKLARSLGQARGEFRKAQDAFEDEAKAAEQQPETARTEK